MFFKHYYSYLNASIGFNLAAFAAGYIPKKSPIAKAKEKDKITDGVVT